MLCTYLIWSGEIQPAGVATKAFLVIMVVVVQRGWLCNFVPFNMILPKQKINVNSILKDTKY